MWANERFINEEAQKLWADRSPEAYDLRDTLLHTFRFAFRHQPDLLRVVDMIAQGNSNADMLQDLKDLTVAGRRNVDLLTAINFDMTVLDRSESLAEELGRIYAEARNDRLSYRRAKLVRDKIATLLKQCVDEVRAHGQYLFWRNEDRRVGYASEYRRSVRQSAAATAGEEAGAPAGEEPQTELVQA